MSTGKRRGFLGGAAILAGAVAITKLIGAVYKIPLGNLLGKEGMGPFQAAYNVYSVLLTVSTAGLPLALSRLVAEADALGRVNQRRRIFRVALGLFFMLGLIGGGLEEQITDFLTEHSATKLVIIDTLQKVRDSKGSAGKAGMYGNDYDDISSIKRIADGFNIAILLVHHLRKLQDSDDPFNDVSGSTGIISAADTNFILRRKRSGNAATLLVSGRDVEYQELTLQFNDLVWELVERKNSEDIHKAELPKFLFRVVDFMECRTEWVGTATELLTEMKEQEVTPNMVTKYLGQFAYEVPEPQGIEYRPKRTGKSRLIKFLRRDGDDANDAGIAI